jgi:ornithine carbamoyltransferase
MTHPSTMLQAVLPAPYDVPALLRQARTLLRVAGTDSARTLLRGKNVGLLCDSPDTASAMLFREAATQLGAQVAHVKPDLSPSSTPQEVQHTARMLGRLYDALECQGMPAALIEQLGRAAGVPVYDGIALPGHSTAPLAYTLGMPSAIDARRCMVQAILLSTIA